MFDNWQQNGQARVLGRIIADLYGLDTQGANMGKVYRLSESADYSDEQYTMRETYAVFDAFPRSGSVGFVPYTAQYGLQAIIYSRLSVWLDLTRLEQLQAIPAALTALVLVLLFGTYLKIYDGLFAVLFLLCLVCAPFVLSMARNLYWSPFLLFLPTLLAGWLYLETVAWRRWIWLLLIMLSMTLKSASNYEYITTVTLLACSVFLVAPLFHDGRPRFSSAALVFLACVLGFLIALVAHAEIRGDTISEGMHTIYIEDIARRTYGDPGLYNHGETAQSLASSPLDVLKIYLFDYPGKRTMIVPGKLFLALILLSVLNIVLKGLMRHRYFCRDFMIFFVFLSVPVSWFVLAKGHSFTQTHINFVLWYIGFMPSLLYLGWSALCSFPEMVGFVRKHYDGRRGSR